MTNLYQITVRKSEFESSQSFKDHYNAAFEDILQLAKLLCQSNHRVVKDYLKNRYVKGSSWLSFTENQVSICAQGKVVQINRNTGEDDTKDIFYDFDKRLPADDYFILALMAILMHHLPGSKLGREVEWGVSDEEFNDGVRLANLVNPKVCNPKNGNICKGLPGDKEFRPVLVALSPNEEIRAFITRKFTGGRRVEVEEAAEPMQKIPKTDPEEQQDIEEEDSPKSESLALF